VCDDIAIVGVAISHVPAHPGGKCKTWMCGDVDEAREMDVLDVRR
jgi:hypothetical protein